MGRSKARTDIRALGHNSATNTIGNGDFTPRSLAEIHKIDNTVLEETATSCLGERASTGVRRSRRVDQRLRVEFFV